MGQGRKRTGPEAPLGKWVWAKAREKGFATKTELYEKLDLSNPAFNAWFSSEAAVPQQMTLDRLKSVLRLNRDERAELDDALRAQVRFREERAEDRGAAKQPPSKPDGPQKSSAEPDGPGEGQRRTVVYVDEYPNRDAAIPLLEDRLPEQVIASLRRIRNSGGDQPIDWWIAKAFELHERRKEIEARLDGRGVFGVAPTPTKPTSRVQFLNARGTITNAVHVVGMFDVPANRKVEAEKPSDFEWTKRAKPDP